MTAYAPPVGADLVGLSEIADRLRVKRQTTKQWKLRGILPPPKWTVGSTPIWEWSTIEKWAKKTGRWPAEADPPA